MTWQLGLILTCLSLVALWLAAEWWASRGMRRRARRRAAFDHYCSMIGRDVKWLSSTKRTTR